MKIYETEVVNIGELAVEMLEEEMLVTFGEEAPSDVAEYCYGIRLNKAEKTVCAGMTMLFDGARYGITAVGTVANDNLNNLGHITLRFDGCTVPETVGALHLEKKMLPDLHIGSCIVIEE